MFDGTYHVILTIIGIGFIIFVHELGHYLAARAVGIRVEAFAIGFGPRLFGWTRGNTDYKLCMIPLGGYVKMAGEDPTKPTTGQPDEFGSKKVWQRVLVISAGVIMNVIFALIAVPIAFAVGIPFEDPVIGSVTPGAPAWEAGLRPGDRVTHVDGRKVLGFFDVAGDVAVSDGPLTLTIERNGETRNIVVAPRDLREEGLPRIGIGISFREFKVSEPDEKIDTHQQRLRDVLAQAGMKPGTSVVAVNGVSVGNGWWMEREIRRAAQKDEPITFRIKDGDALRDVTIPNEPTDSESMRIGVMAGGPRLKRFRDGLWQQLARDLRAAGYSTSVEQLSPLAEKGILPGDIFLSINGIRFSGLTDIARALGEGTNVFADPIQGQRPPPANPNVTIEIARISGEGADEKAEATTIVMSLPTWESRRAMLDGFEWSFSESRCLYVSPGTPAAKAGLKSGDYLVSVNGKPADGFQAIVDAVDQGDEEHPPIEIVVLRPDGRHTVSVTPTMMKKNLITEGSGGLLVPEHPRWVVRESFGDSIKIGVIHTGRMINRVVSTLRSLFRGSVSPKHLGGIITIFRASKSQSKIGPMRLLLFLAMVSINLAILNILPIPVLDGGWLVFLIIEKIKGSPVTESTMAKFQWLGLIFVLSLMVYVTWRDIDRLISGL